MQVSFLPILLFVLCMFGLAAAMLMISAVFNPGRSGRVARMPYESGMDPIHDTRRRFDVRFHLVAIAFLVFDVELLFLYPWAVAAHPAGPGAGIGLGPPPTPGIDAAVYNGLVGSRDIVFCGAMIFLLLLTLGFVYDWRKGVFRWR